MIWAVADARRADLLSLRETDVIRIRQLTPPTTARCESTRHGFAPDTQSRAAEARKRSTEQYPMV
jgi:hypothetical protein